MTGEPWPGNPFVRADNRAQALRLHLRPPQRAGTRPAPRRHAVVGRARLLPRRRGQPAPRRRRLRLAPGARLQRVGPDDRPLAARASRSPPAGAPATRPSPPRAAPGSTARSGASSTAPSPSPRSRPNRVVFMKFDGQGRLKWTKAPGEAAPARAAALGHAHPQQRPAADDRQRRRHRRGPAGQRRSAGAVRTQPAQPNIAAPPTTAADPHDGQPDRQPRQPGRVRATTTRSATTRTTSQRIDEPEHHEPGRRQHAGADQEQHARHPDHPDERPRRGLRPAAAAAAARSRRLSPRGSSFQFGSLSHSSLRSSTFSRAREAASSVSNGPSRSIGGHMSPPDSTRWCLTQNQYDAAMSLMPRKLHSPPCLSQPPSLPARDLRTASRARPHRPAGVRRPPRARALHRQRGQGRRDDREDAGGRPAGRPGPRAGRLPRRARASRPTSSTGSATSSSATTAPTPRRSATGASPRACARASTR